MDILVCSMWCTTVVLLLFYVLRCKWYYYIWLTTVLYHDLLHHAAALSCCGSLVMSLLPELDLPLDAVTCTSVVLVLVLIV